jgi:hypothetical protein
MGSARTHAWSAAPPPCIRYSEARMGKETFMQGMVYLVAA